MEEREIKVRKLKDKDVADVMRDALGERAPAPGEIHSSLHRAYKSLDRNSFAERDAMKEILACNILLANAVSTMSKQILVLIGEVQLLKQARAED